MCFYLLVSGPDRSDVVVLSCVVAVFPNYRILQHPAGLCQSCGLVFLPLFALLQLHIELCEIRVAQLCCAVHKIIFNMAMVVSVLMSEQILLGKLSSV